jgi:hypothetical protein
MIELMMLLFIAGGQHKPAKAPCTLTNVSASGSFSTNCEADRNWRVYGDGKKATVHKPAKANHSLHENPLVCVFANKEIPCNRRFIPKMARTSDICKIKDAPNEPAPGVICIGGVRFEEAKVKPAPGLTKPMKDEPVTFYEYIQHPQHEQLEGSYADPIHPPATYRGGGHVSTAISGDNSKDLLGEGFKASALASPHSATMFALDGSKAVKLSDSEYSHLQELRKAVADEEKRLAVKYGAEEESCGDLTVTNLRSPTICDSGWVPADHYEYHGQFLLIEKGSEGKR